MSKSLAAQELGKDGEAKREPPLYPKLNDQSKPSTLSRFDGVSEMLAKISPKSGSPENDLGLATDNSAQDTPAAFVIF
jgi:hypothetical protein